MNEKTKVLVLVGSPKTDKSASEFIANLIIDSFNRRNMHVEKKYIYTMLRQKEGYAGMLSSVNSADVIVFSCPLYIDAPPCMVTKAMEFIKENRQQINGSKKMLVISNGGYPETLHGETALAIYREFAEESGFEWIAGLAVGMGAMMNVRILQKCGFLFKKIKKQIDDIVISFSEGKEIISNNGCIDAKPFVPIWLYYEGTRLAPWFMAGGNAVWKIYDRPYF